MGCEEQIGYAKYTRSSLPVEGLVPKLLHQGVHRHASKGANSRLLRLKKALLQFVEQKHLEVSVHGGQETAKGLDSGIEIVHGCFTERGDSIKSKHFRWRTVAIEAR